MEKYCDKKNFNYELNKKLKKEMLMKHPLYKSIYMYINKIKYAMPDVF